MHRCLMLLFALCTLAAPLVHALDTQTRPVSPARAWTAEDLERFDPAWLHVKFVEGSNVCLEDGRLVDASRWDLSRVNAVLAREVVTEIRRTIPQDAGVLRDWKAAGEARSGVVGPDLSLWFDVRLEGGREAVARLIDALNRCREVEIAHPAPMVEPAGIRSQVSSALAGPERTPDFASQQGYLYFPPVGLYAPAAWAVAGGHGEEMKFIDVELAWCENHEDFDFGQLFYVGGALQNPDYEDHGTAVLGEVLGQPNGYGVNGFASGVRYGVESVDINEWPNVPHRFLDAVNHLDPGDVWLIELQMFPPGFSATPMEWLQVNYDVIWTSVWSRGIVCVEAGANGSQDLDDPIWSGVFDRRLRDSGAIMVAAGTPYQRMAEYFTNYGSRMDAHAWGSSIVTTGYGDLYNGGTPQTRYTSSFGGTSGASPMVTGSALCLQGIAKANLGTPLDPIALRTLIHDTGVPHLDPSREIGPRPDLGAAVEALLGFTAAPEVGPTSGTALRLAIAPNPSPAGAEIRCAPRATAPMRLVILDAAGRCVRMLFDGVAPSGEMRLTWDGRDERGRDTGAGTYYLQLQQGAARSERAIVRMR